MENYFNELNQVDVSDKIEKKNGLSYVSWAYAWGELKKRHPDANYKVYENEQGWNYFTDNRTAWVKTGVTVNGIEHIEYLPIMDFKNKSIPLDNITSFDVNKTIQRSLTKAVARHGLGLYVYAGEDLPEETKEDVDSFKKEATAEKTAKTRAINKAIKEGTEYKEPVNEKSLAERYKKAVAWLDNQTTESWLNAAPSYKDSINILIEKLDEAGSTGWRDDLKSKVEKLVNLDDEIKY